MWKYTQKYHILRSYETLNDIIETNIEEKHEEFDDFQDELLNNTPFFEKFFLRDT